MLLKKCAQILQQVQDERSEEVYPEFIEGSAEKAWTCVYYNFSDNEVLRSFMRSKKPVEA